MRSIRSGGMEVASSARLLRAQELTPRTSSGADRKHTPFAAARELRGRNMRRAGAAVAPVREIFAQGSPAFCDGYHRQARSRCARVDRPARRREARVDADQMGVEGRVMILDSGMPFWKAEQLVLVLLLLRAQQGNFPTPPVPPCMLVWDRRDCPTQMRMRVIQGRLTTSSEPPHTSRPETYFV